MNCNKKKKTINTETQECPVTYFLHEKIKSAKEKKE